MGFGRLSKILLAVLLPALHGPRVLAGPAPAPALVTRLEDVVELLLSPEPRFSGVHQLITEGRYLFPVAISIAERKTHGDTTEAYRYIESYFAQKIEEHREVIEAGEAYRAQYYRNRLAPTGCPMRRIR